MLTVVTPASTQDLCLLADVKAELAGDPDTLNQAADKVLADLIAAASSAISAYCHRTFGQQVYTETLPSYGGTLLRLEHTPVLAVASLLFQGQAVTDFSIDDPEAGFLYRQSLFADTVQVGWNLAGFVAPWTVARDATGGWSCTYTAGYVLPGQASPPLAVAPGVPALPRDLRKACVEYTKWFWLRRKLDPEVLTRRVDTLMVSYRPDVRGVDTEAPDLPRTVKPLVAAYTRAFDT